MKNLLMSLTALTATALLTAPASAQAMMMHAGSLHSLGAPTSGKVSVSAAGGKVTVKLSALKTEPGPGPQVGLYAAAAPGKGTKDTDIARGEYVKVGDLRKFSGNFSFTAPAGTEIADYRSVVLWCADVKTAFGAGDLN